jgi:probable HAF family extracellular repeat protein
MQPPGGTLVTGRLRAWLFGLSMILGLTACGGGGGSTESQALPGEASLSLARDLERASPPASTIAAAYGVVVLDANADPVGPLNMNATGQVAFTSLGRALLYNGASVQDLGTLGGASAAAIAINDLGQVTGRSLTAEGSSHAFRWTPTDATTGVMLDLGAPPGASSVGQAINNAGQVAGTVRAGNSPSRAFLWTEGVGMTDLGALGGQFPFASALFVNDASQVAGQTGVQTDQAATVAFIWSPESGIRALGTARDSFVRDLNEAGQIVGVAGARVTGMTGDAFLFSPGVGTLGLGTLGGSNSDALAINDAGQVVGEAEIAISSPVVHAFIWSPTGPLPRTMIDLGTLGGQTSSARDINSLGVVVGTAQTAASASHAFAWSATDGMVDLNTRVPTAPAGLVLISAVAISDSGAILALSNMGLVLLKPVVGPASVTGSIGIASPPGAFAADIGLATRARFISVARYQKDATQPIGHTTFRLDGANFNFESTAYDWLLVDDGVAQYQGQGTVNGSGNYRFRVTFSDAGAGGATEDSLRIRIWHVDPVSLAEVVDYDNQTATAAIAGNIVVRAQ